MRGNFLLRLNTKRFSKSPILNIFLLVATLYPSISLAQFLTSPDWFLPSSGSANHSYAWQQDPKYYDALAYNVSMILFDLHNFDCFDPASPEKCFNSMQRCPVPRTKTDGSPDNNSWDDFMENFNNPRGGYDNGYCTSYTELIGDTSGATAQYPANIISSPLFNSNFSNTKLTNRQGYMLDSYAVVPKALRRSAVATTRQIMNGVKFGIPTSTLPLPLQVFLPTNTKMTCDGSGGTENFKNFRNFATYNDNIDINPNNGTNESRRPIKGPVGFYDCAQRVNTSHFPSQGVDFTIRDRGINPDNKCVDQRVIYFSDNDCTGYAYFDQGTTEPAKDFYRFRDISSADEAVVDLSQTPFTGSGPGADILARSLNLDSYPNPFGPGVTKTMHQVLTDFSTDSGSNENRKKAIVVAFYTEILDRTIYYAKNDEIFRRTVIFDYQGGSKTPLSSNYQNFIKHRRFIANFSDAPDSRRNTDGSCDNLNGGQKNALIGHYMGYLDRLDGNITDYSGFVMRPYREITPTAPASMQRALYVNTIPTKTFGTWGGYVDNGTFNLNQMGDFLDFLELYYPVARSPMVKEDNYGPANQNGPGSDNVFEPSGKDCGPPSLGSGTNIGNLINILPVPAFPSNILCRVTCPAGSGSAGDCNDSLSTPWSVVCKSTCYSSQKRYQPIEVTRREWWTPDGYADKSGLLNVLSCAPDEHLLAIGKEDPTTSFSATPKSYPGYAAAPPQLNPLSGGTNPYCASLDGSNPPKCVRVGYPSLKENFNKYCIRYLIGKKVRRDQNGNVLFGPFGNPLFEMSSLNQGVMGGALICEDDEIYLKKASANFPAGPYSHAAKQDGTDYDNHLNNDAYFYKEVQTSSSSPVIDAKLLLEQKYNSPDGEMTIPARSIGLGNPSAKLPMNHGVCVRPKLEPDYPLLQMGPLSLPFRNYLVDYLIRNTEGIGTTTVPPNCP